MITEDNFSQIYSASFQYNSKVNIVFISPLLELQSASLILSSLHVAPQALHDVRMDLAVPNLNDLVKTEGYKSMSDELQKRLIQELADEDVKFF